MSFDQRGKGQHFGQICHEELPGTGRQESRYDLMLPRYGLGLVVSRYNYHLPIRDEGVPHVLGGINMPDHKNLLASCGATAEDVDKEE
jgi:hypothetical protein